MAVNSKAISEDISVTAHAHDHDHGIWQNIQDLWQNLKYRWQGFKQEFKKRPFYTSFVLLLVLMIALGFGILAAGGAYLALGSLIISAAVFAVTMPVEFFVYQICMDASFERHQKFLNKPHKTWSDIAWRLLPSAVTIVGALGMTVATFVEAQVLLGASGVVLPFMPIIFGITGVIMGFGYYMQMADSLDDMLGTVRASIQKYGLKGACTRAINYIKNIKANFLELWANGNSRIKLLCSIAVIGLITSLLLPAGCIISMITFGATIAGSGILAGHLPLAIVVSACTAFVYSCYNIDHIGNDLKEGWLPQFTQPRFHDANEIEMTSTPLSFTPASPTSPSQSSAANDDHTQHNCLPKAIYIGMVIVLLVHVSAGSFIGAHSILLAIPIALTEFLVDRDFFFGKGPKHVAPPPPESAPASPAYSLYSPRQAPNNTLTPKTRAAYNSALESASSETLDDRMSLNRTFSPTSPISP